MVWLGEPRSGHSTPDRALLGQNRAGGEPPSTCWPHSAYCTPGSHWPSWQQGHTAGLWSTCHRPAASQQVSPTPVLVHGVIPPQVQDPALALVELHEVPLCPALQPVQVLLNGSTAFWFISHFSMFGAISKLAEGTLCPFIQVADEEVEQDWAEY